MTDQITEALAVPARPIGNQVRSMEGLYALPLDVIDVRTKLARAYVRDWITCPTCNGYGERLIENDGRYHHEVCPDCVDGMIPSPELRDRGAKAAAVELRRLNRQAVGGFDVESIDPVSRLIADAVLLASRRKEER